MSSSIDQLNSQPGDRPNSASELERLLPLLPSCESEDALRVQALLAVASADEQALAEAYEADDQALASYAASQQGEHPILIGFADSVMAQLAAEAATSHARPQETLVASSAGERRQAPILRPAFGGTRSLIAMAALFLGAIGLAILFSAEEVSLSPRSGTTNVVAGVEPSGDLEPSTSPAGVGAQAELESTAPQFAAPARPGARQRRAPRGRRGIVPVDGRGGQKSNPLLDALMRGWQPPTRVPPLAEGERELKF